MNSDGTSLLRSSKLSQRSVCIMSSVIELSVSVFVLHLDAVISHML
jgi:hypothetical protein